MKILLFFGTRPETIKLAPVLRELQACPRIKPIVCVSTQHRELLEQALQVFSIVPDYNLGIMTPGQSLFRITRLMLAGLEPILEEEHPDLVLKRHQEDDRHCQRYDSVPESVRGAPEFLTEHCPDLAPNAFHRSPQPVESLGAIIVFSRRIWDRVSILSRLP